MQPSWTHRPHGEEPDPEFFHRMSPPENEVPVVLPVGRLVARTADAAVAVTRLAVYSTGVLLDLVVRARPDTLRMTDLHSMMWRPGDGPPGLLLGLEFADGTRVDNNRRQGSMDGVTFALQGGSGNEHSVDQGWWLHPLPPAGPIRLVVRCAALGIDETSVELDGDAVRRAAGEVVELWPWTPPRPNDEEPVQRWPEIPGDSWFAD